MLDAALDSDESFSLGFREAAHPIIEVPRLELFCTAEVFKVLQNVPSVAVSVGDGCVGFTTK